MIMMIMMLTMMIVYDKGDIYYEDDDAVMKLYDDDDKMKSLHPFFCFFFENQVQVKPVPCASPMIASCTSTLPTAAQTQRAVFPQAQPSVLMPTQQQVPNSLVLYATPAGTIPVQRIVPQVVAQIPTQYQSCMVPTIPGIPGVPGQVDVNTAAQHGVPTVQPVVSKIIV